MATEHPASQDMVGAINLIQWEQCREAAAALWDRHRHNPPRYLYGVPRGGSVAALLVAQAARGVSNSAPVLLDAPTTCGDTLVVDDIAGTGRTMAGYFRQGYRTDALFRCPATPFDYAPGAPTLHGWATFPWETKEGTGAEDVVVRLLQYIGEDPTRDGLVDTPRRVLKAWKELTRGYDQDPKDILGVCFDQPHDELIMLRDIEFHSTCEHHLLPFYGTATVGYIPDMKVVGISKLARLVECYGRRLQIQERMCSQIAKAVMEHLAPLGVGVVLNAKHMCMGCRGVVKPDATMVTSVMLGRLRDSAQARGEFLTLAAI